jgi:hypothetical protein
MAFLSPEEARPSILLDVLQFGCFPGWERYSENSVEEIPEETAFEREP